MAALRISLGTIRGEDYSAAVQWVASERDPVVELGRLVLVGADGTEDEIEESDVIPLCKAMREARFLYCESELAWAEAPGASSEIVAHVQIAVAAAESAGFEHAGQLREPAMVDDLWDLECSRDPAYIAVLGEDRARSAWECGRRGGRVL